MQEFTGAKMKRTQDYKENVYIGGFSFQYVLSPSNRVSDSMVEELGSIVY
jgi:hypothetical protein